MYLVVKVMLRNYCFFQKILAPGNKKLIINNEHI